jgi:hypothetical protein
VWSDPTPMALSGGPTREVSPEQETSRYTGGSGHRSLPREAADDRSSDCMDGVYGSPARWEAGWHMRCHRRGPSTSWAGPRQRAERGCKEAFGSRSDLVEHVGHPSG